MRDWVEEIYPDVEERLYAAEEVLDVQVRGVCVDISWRLGRDAVRGIFLCTGFKQ